MIVDEFRLEEYRSMKTAVETRDERYYQLLVFSFTGFAAILGISDKIPSEIIPYMISPLLLVTILVATRARRELNFRSAFLLEVFECRMPHLLAEHASSEIWLTSRNPSKIRNAIRPYTSFIFHPYTILYILGFFSSLYFGIGFLKEQWVLGKGWTLTAYTGILLLIYFVMARALFLERQKDIQYYRKLCREYIEKIESKLDKDNTLQ